MLIIPPIVQDHHFGGGVFRSAGQRVAAEQTASREPLRVGRSRHLIPLKPAFFIGRHPIASPSHWLATYSRNVAM